MQLYFFFNTRQQSHKSLSKMLIEHTRGSTEDKPEKYIFVGALRRSAGCFNQQSLLGQPAQHVSQQPSKQPNGQLKVNPRKVNAAQKSQRRTTASKSQCSSVFSQPLTSFLVPKCTNFRNRSLCQKSAPFDHALTKVNTGQTCGGNPSCSKNIFVLISHM